MVNHSPLVMLGLLVVALIVLGALFGKSAPKHVYQRIDFILTPPERELYRSLLRAVGSRYAIFAKVRIADVLAVRGGIKSKNDWGTFARISSKHVDFVLSSLDDFKILCAIELDDKSHQRKDRSERDKFVDGAFASAELPLIRIPLKRGITVAYLQDLVETTLNPPPHAKRVGKLSSRGA